MRQDLADGECVLLHQGTEEYFSLDAVAVRMVDVAMNAETVDEAVGRLTSEYDADQAVIRADLIELLDRLAELALVDRSPG